MSQSYCERYGITSSVRAERLALVELSTADEALAERLHTDVIASNAHAIVEEFYGKILQFPEVRRILDRESIIDRLKETQTAYLMTLGRGFTSQQYFEARLRIGYAHLRARVRPILFQCAYRIMQQLIIDKIPSDHSKHYQLAAFVLKISTLDMSLAIESYEDRLTERLKTSVEALQKQKSSLSAQVATDALTGVLSRQRILEILEERLKCLDYDDTVVVIMADLDHFKEINDSYGHVVGDQVLIDTAQRMRRAIRRANAVGRYGGEEFLIVLDNTPLEQAELIAERIRARLAMQPINVGQVEIPITISLGLATALVNDTIETVIERADSALYRAKREGRDRVAVHIR